MISQTSEEIILPFPAPARDDRDGEAKLRSTLVASSARVAAAAQSSSIATARLLPAEHREVILSTVAGLWLPMEVGLAHYEAVDRLGFTTEEEEQIGAEVSHKLHDTFLGTVMKMATNAGVTPWTLLPKGNQFYGRLFRGGGGTRVIKLGPKEARSDVVGLPLLSRFPSLSRHAVRGLYPRSHLGFLHQVLRARGHSQVVVDVDCVPDLVGVSAGLPRYCT